MKQKLFNSTKDLKSFHLLLLNMMFTDRSYYIWRLNRKCLNYRIIWELSELLLYSLSCAPYNGLGVMTQSKNNERCWLISPSFLKRIKGGKKSLRFLNFWSNLQDVLNTKIYLAFQLSLSFSHQLQLELVCKWEFFPFYPFSFRTVSLQILSYLLRTVWAYELILTC